MAMHLNEFGYEYIVADIDWTLEDWIKQKRHLFIESISQDTMKDVFLWVDPCMRKTKTITSVVVFSANRA